MIACIYDSHILCHTYDKHTYDCLYDYQTYDHTCIWIHTYDCMCMIHTTYSIVSHIQCIWLFVWLSDIWFTHINTCMWLHVHDSHILFHAYDKHAYDCSEHCSYMITRHVITHMNTSIWLHAYDSHICVTHMINIHMIFLIWPSDTWIHVYEYMYDSLRHMIIRHNMISWIFHHH